MRGLACKCSRKYTSAADVQEQAELRAQLARNAAMLDALTHAAAHGTETLTVCHPQCRCEDGLLRGSHTYGVASTRV
jgi:hypothetical protein